MVVAGAPMPLVSEPESQPYAFLGDLAFIYRGLTAYKGSWPDGGGPRPPMTVVPMDEEPTVMATLIMQPSFHLGVGVQLDLHHPLIRTVTGLKRKLLPNEVYTHTLSKSERTNAEVSSQYLVSCFRLPDTVGPYDLYTAAVLRGLPLDSGFIDFVARDIRATLARNGVEAVVYPVIVHQSCNLPAGPWHNLEAILLVDVVGVAGATGDNSPDALKREVRELLGVHSPSPCTIEAGGIPLLAFKTISGVTSTRLPFQRLVTSDSREYMSLSKKKETTPAVSLRQLLDLLFHSVDLTSVMGVYQRDSRTHTIWVVIFEWGTWCPALKAVLLSALLPNDDPAIKIRAFDSVQVTHIPPGLEEQDAQYQVGLPPLGKSEMRRTSSQSSRPQRDPDSPVLPQENPPKHSRGPQGERNPPSDNRSRDRPRDDRRRDHPRDRERTPYERPREPLGTQRPNPPVQPQNSQVAPADITQPGVTRPPPETLRPRADRSSDHAARREVPRDPLSSSISEFRRAVVENTARGNSNPPQAANPPQSRSSSQPPPTPSPLPPGMLRTRFPSADDYHPEW